MPPFPAHPWPPAITPLQLSHLTTLASTHALAHSLLYLPPHSPSSPPPTHPASAIHAPLSLFPTPVPRVLFARAQELQRAYNTLYARVAMDTAFLDEIMGAGGVADVDEFTGELWRAWKSVRNESVQPLQLGLFRSDYLLHQPDGEGGAVGLKQVEFNTISSSFGALSERVAALHRHLYAATSYFDASPLLKQGCFPPNKTVAGLAEGIAAAHRAYANPSANVLFVVQPNERNIFDQRLLEYELLETHSIRVVRRTLPELQTCALVTDTRALLIALPTSPPDTSSTPPFSMAEISVVYFRAGYTPNDYTFAGAYDVRARIERSRAIQCPSLALQLAGGKKVQEVLTRPGVLERFLAPAEGVDAVRETWVGMWGLDAGHELIPPGANPAGVDLDGAGHATEPAGTRLARARADALVLKPQREGGGNNVYRGAVPGFLDALPAPERAAWIAMELIRPPRAVGGYLVRSSAPSGSGPELREEAEDGRVWKGPVVSELGIFGWALFGAGGRVGVVEAPAGWLVRTKAEGVDEGGVAAGFSVLDSVLLVD